MITYCARGKEDEKFPAENSCGRPMRIGVR